MMRLDKFLCECGLGTRSEVKKLIKSSRISLNGVIRKSPELHVLENEDVVALDGEPIKYQKFRYYLLHKPKGCVSAVTDAEHPTVMEYLTGVNTKDCSPVGRLDIDTEGLLLITNDGALSHRLTSPAHHIPKVYFAQLCGDCPEEAVTLFKYGIDIGDEKPTLPAKLNILSDPSQISLTIYEGRFHQVKRMFQEIGLTVTYLRRESMGGLELGDLKPGEFRPLIESEVESLKKS